MNLCGRVSKKNAKFLFVENMLEEVLVSQTNEKKSFDIPITSELLKIAVFEVSTLHKHDLIDDEEFDLNKKNSVLESTVAESKNVNDKFSFETKL